eukprot:GFKZ01006563.1.p1 GENE.GFKZ01006563.1~~GFKZ01006563.1.p1  ORF type:complete len:979 (-),score=216.90 GFKZ01006563.1:257-3052(-)
MRRRHPHAYELFSRSSTPRAKRPRLSATLKAASPSQRPTSQPDGSAAPQPAITPLPASSAPSQPSPTPPQAATAAIAAPTAAVVTHQPTRSLHRPSPPSVTANPSQPNMLLELALVSATYRAALRTPCTSAPSLSHRTKCQIYLKREDLQITGSPIFRAAYNYLSTIPTARNGVLAVGPSALPVAAAAQKHAKSCVVVIPTNATQTVRRLLKSYGAKIENGSETLEGCVTEGRRMAAVMHRTFVDVACGKVLSEAGDAVVGYATLGMEMLQQCPHVGRVFVKGGNAMLVKGVAAVLGRLGRGVKLVGVVMEEEPGGEWEGFVDEVVRVGWGEVCAAAGWVFEEGEGGGMLEWSGVLSVAGAVKYVKVGGVTHERVVCVVEEPCRSWESVGRMGRVSWKGDGSRCWLWVSGKNGSGGGLGELMKELAGTAGGGVKVTGLRWRGEWPMLLGLKCDEEVTGVMHVGNLMAMGYEVEDVTARDFGVDEMWTWGEDKEQGAGGSWTIFRVELWETSDAVLKFLSEERVGGDGVVRRVSFTEGERGVMRLLVGAWGSEWQVEELERRMTEVARSVKRIDGDRKGVVVLGIGGGGNQESNNGVIRVCEAVGNGDEAMEVAEEEANGGDENGVEISIRFATGEAGTIEVHGGGKRDEEVEMQDEGHITHVGVEGEDGGIEGEEGQGEGDASGENGVHGAEENEMEVEIEGHMEGGEGEEEEGTEGEHRVMEVEAAETVAKLEGEAVEEVAAEEGEGEGGGGGASGADGEVEGVEGEGGVVDEDEAVNEGGHVEDAHLEEDGIEGDEEAVHVDVEECEGVVDGHDGHNGHDAHDGHVGHDGTDGHDGHHGSDGHEVHECEGDEDAGNGGEGAGTGDGEMEIVGEEELEVKGEVAECCRAEDASAGRLSATATEVGLGSESDPGPGPTSAAGAECGPGQDG